MDFESACVDADDCAERLDMTALVARDSTVREDAIALGAMLRALARSVRLAVVAGHDPDDIAALADEVHAARSQAERIIALGDGLTEPAIDPASQRPTSPPPPGYNLEEELARGASARLARIKLRRG